MVSFSSCLPKLYSEYFYVQYHNLKDISMTTVSLGFIFTIWFPEFKTQWVCFNDTDNEFETNNKSTKNISSFKPKNIIFICGVTQDCDILKTYYLSVRQSGDIWSEFSAEQWRLGQLKVSNRILTQGRFPQTLCGNPLDFFQNQLCIIDLDAAM